MLSVFKILLNVCIFNVHFSAKYLCIVTLSDYEFHLCKCNVLMTVNIACTVRILAHVVAKTVLICNSKYACTVTFDGCHAVSVFTGFSNFSLYLM